MKTRLGLAIVMVSSALVACGASNSGGCINRQAYEAYLDSNWNLLMRMMDDIEERKFEYNSNGDWIRLHRQYAELIQAADPALAAQHRDYANLREEYGFATLGSNELSMQEDYDYQMRINTEQPDLPTSVDSPPFPFC